MKKNHSWDPVESLIRAAQPEMSRMKDAAELGFDTRLRSALREQSSAIWPAWEATARRSLQVAVGVTAAIVLQVGVRISSQGWDAVLQTEWTLEQVFLGI